MGRRRKRFPESVLRGGCHSLPEVTQRNVNLIAALESMANRNRTRGEILADWATATVGSWTFLIVQTVLLILWMAINLVAWSSHWDPYPFVLLNLALSFQAAFATPVILMSQNRQSRLSEQRNELDLQINLLAEQENTEQLRLLRLLCEKLNIREISADEPAFEEAAEPEQIIQQIIDSQRANHVAGPTTKESQS